MNPPLSSEQQVPVQSASLRKPSGAFPAPRSALRTFNKPHQRGLTLVELLVAMVLGLMIVVAAAAALLVSRQGFSTVDAASQLRDNSRFVRDLIQQLVVQAGYKNLEFVAAASPRTTANSTSQPPNIYGLNNRSRTSKQTWREGDNRAASSVGYGSDILVLRYQTSTFTTFPPKSDNTIINCMGSSPNEISENANDRLVSILHVGMDTTNEPSLMCSTAPTNDYVDIKPGKPQPLIRGVESFQVLYGVDGVAPGNVIQPISPDTADSVPERYLRADQLTVTSDGKDAATHANWARVRSIRIGMVLRGPPNSAAEKSSQTYFPFGVAKAGASDAPGSAYAVSDDPGTSFTPPLDGRLRQTLSFTVHLRNHQEVQ